MQWCEFRTLRRFASTLPGAAPTLSAFYNGSIRNAMSVSHELAGQLLCEKSFHEANCPYYCVHRSIADGLCRVSLDIDCSYFKLPLETLELRFREPGWNGIRSIFAAEINTHDGPGIGVWVDCGETDAYGGPCSIYNKFQWKEGVTVAKCLEDLPWHNEITEDEQKLIRTCVQLVLAVCLVGQDDEMVSPDVLTADRAKLNAENAERLAEKARRRGKVGWVLGDDSNTMSPHYRCPHFAIRWTGVGRKVARLTKIKGSTIHRDQVTNVPTGFEDE